MNRAEINAFCATLPATAHVVQWGNSDVWKVGGPTGKVFAVIGWSDGKDAVSFRVTDLAFEILPDSPGIRPAPYLASRGMKWVQVFREPGVDKMGLSDTSLQDHLRLSYAIISKGLSKKKRAEMGIPEPDL